MSNFPYFINILTSLSILLFGCSKEQNTDDNVKESISLEEFKGEIAWSDDFNGKELDTTKWNYRQLGKKRWDAFITSNAVIIRDGLMEIRTFSENGDQGDLSHYTGMIGTEGLFQNKYGVFEALIDFNTSPGMWSAFWLQSPTIGNPVDNPEKAGVEMDIIEHRKVNKEGINIERTAHQALHWNGYGDAHKKVENDTNNNLSIHEGFHLYSLVWTPKSYYFFVDQNLIKTWSPPQVPISEKEQYIIFSSEVKNNNWSGNIPQNGYGSLESSSTSMIVDYVRVYSLK